MRRLAFWLDALRHRQGQSSHSPFGLVAPPRHENGLSPTRKRLLRRLHKNLFHHIRAACRAPPRRRGRAQQSDRRRPRHLCLGPFTSRRGIWYNTRQSCDCLRRLSLPRALFVWGGSCLQVKVLAGWCFPVCRTNRKKNRNEHRQVRHC